MKILAIGARFLLGLMFVIFGANAIHSFIPVPPGLPDIVVQFNNIMIGSGWMRAIGWIQVFGGLLLFYSGTVPLGLTFLGPVILNILLFHMYVMHFAGIAPGFLAAILEVVLVYIYRDNFRGILTTKAVPTTK